MSKGKKKKSRAKQKAPKIQQTERRDSPKQPRIEQEESKVEQKSIENKSKFCEKLKRLMSDWRFWTSTIIGIILIALTLYLVANACSSSHHDAIINRVENVGTAKGIVNDTILEKQKGNESVEDLQILADELENHYKAAKFALGKGDFGEAENQANECSRILTLIQPHVLTVDYPNYPNVSVMAAEGFLSMSVDTGNATTCTLNGERVTTIILAGGHLPAPIPTNQKLVVSYLLSPEGAIFDQPVNITFHYGGNRVPEGFPEERLILLTWDKENKQLIEIPNTNINVETHSITMSITHITGFYIVVAPNP